MEHCESLEDKTEKELENFLFSEFHTREVFAGVVEKTEVGDILHDSLDSTPDEHLFFVDKSVSLAVSTPLASQSLDSATTESTKVSNKLDRGRKAAAWSDEDEKLTTVAPHSSSSSVFVDTSSAANPPNLESSLRKRHAKLFPTPTWASPTVDISETDADSPSLFSSANSFKLPKTTSKTLKALPPQLIDISYCKDVNWQDPSHSIVTSVHWHPKESVLLTAGLDKTLRLFFVDGKENPKLQSIHFPNTPISKARFLTNGEEIVVTGKRSSFFVYNVERGVVQKVREIQGRDEKAWTSFECSPCGQFITFVGSDGCLVVVSQKSKQWVHTMRMNSAVCALSYSTDGSTLWSTGVGGEIYEWDMRSFQCRKRWQDEGSFHSVTLASSSSYLACGSDSGIVNIYASSAPPSTTTTTTPHSHRHVKTVTNLTTSISQLSFSPDSQMLAISSRVKQNQFKLVHCPTFSVFTNWPTIKTPLGYVQSFDFSPSGGYIAIGNDKGRVLLFRLNHFNSS